MIESKFVAAVVQAAPQYLDLDASVTKAIDLIGEASAAGASLIAFPELWLPGYPWWVWMGSDEWAASHDFTDRYRHAAFDYSSRHALRLREAARKYGMAVVMGVAERADETLYIGQWLIGGDGQTLWRRRKLKPGFLERKLFSEGGGGNLTVVDTPLGRLGGLCCSEHRHPLFKYALYAQGEEIHIAAWPSFQPHQAKRPGIGPVVNNALSQVYAIEGGCYVLAPCALVTDAMIEALCDTAERRAFLRRGGGFACAFNPHGAPVGGLIDEHEEGLVLVTIDPDEIRAAKSAYDVAGHSARLDIVGLSWASAGETSSEEVDDV
ncbi:carbon-nitrogen hydrolase family protein [Pusillimonas caeni]|uniref:carbon-nitrogen hydrolase family protein n=1 Tax=Pusillimonas caeni TaxID=1348472 RepID=UPI0014308CBA|nr:carbon-nitrogen hydrolase family protein [Pusillimonas caeni]